MTTELETQEFVVQTSDERVLRYHRYLDETEISWVRHGWFTEELNGNVLSEGEYRHGREVGIWRDYYPSGVLAAEGPYEDGVEQGLWCFWDEEGRPERAIAYVQGVES